jgi:hypothetical protein
MWRERERKRKKERERRSQTSKLRKALHAQTNRQIHSKLTNSAQMKSEQLAN